ncbi:M15 family metallopeptidase [Paucihalobacter ruber]|uniref:D-alanyl-D-alanine dipeptidase n=1 Tax=Paucihalobacter ruber TaxID=2567861 RepID=A0A506PTE7_9FLAO|nr:M15 family metallopeptidase [Paucihalobacter ruber]
MFSFRYKLFIFFIGSLLFSGQLKAQLPDGFVYVEDIIPDIGVKLSYYSHYNFVGDTIDGYRANKLILTRETAIALAKVQSYLQSQNLCLIVFDGYRPQAAVDHFVRWANDLNDTLMKSVFYPEVEKQYLFRDGYIASKSGHSRGSTLDLGLINGNTGELIDMGTIFDFFGEASGVNYLNLTNSQIKNRQILQEAMKRFGFRNYPMEWWHFTLRNEPFPETYFDFPVE